MTEENTSAGPAWTAGPWTWREPGETYPSEGGFFGPNGETICDFGDDEPYENSCGEAPNEANARLISAAPDLYEALEELTRASYANAFGYEKKRVGEACIAAAAALHKANPALAASMTGAQGDSPEPPQ